MDKIICVGKNYHRHALELGDAVPEKPVLFLKPASVLLAAREEGETLRTPLQQDFGEVHYECEVVVRLRHGGSRLTEEEAAKAIDAWTLGLDMTRRDLQSQLKKNGHPWEVGKVFAGSALIGPFVPGPPEAVLSKDSFSLWIDGVLRQRGQMADMSLSPAACVAYASTYFPLCAGDLVFTGTPEGVGPVKPGQVAELRRGDRVMFRVAWAS
jgi:2-keto-4-pentenoate hydratase/2-oxohepta-3-ene-1,7-dioic acid hydratase in catechol pathway